MSRIAHAFAQARSSHRSAFVAYLCAGDPDLETSVAACRTLVENGVDILELGVPFSDPLADGLTNQLAAQRALASGMNTSKVFELVRRVREFSEVPIVFYTYYNLVFANGVDAYIKLAKAAGVDGMLTLDLPPEEAGEVLVPISEGVFSKEDVVGELPEMCAGKCPLRENDEAVTLFKSIGMAYSDLVGAGLAYQAVVGKA